MAQDTRPLVSTPITRAANPVDAQTGQVCCFFLTGMCNRGDNCVHTHSDDGVSPCSNRHKCASHRQRNEAAAAAAAIPVCCYFLSGKCREAEGSCPHQHTDLGGPCSNQYKCRSHASRNQRAGGGAPPPHPFSGGVPVVPRIAPPPAGEYSRYPQLLRPPAPAPRPAPAYGGGAAAPVCCFFLERGCKAGESCRYSHVDTGGPCSNQHKCASHRSRNSAGDGGGGGGVRRPALVAPPVTPFYRAPLTSVVAPPRMSVVAPPVPGRGPSGYSAIRPTQVLQQGPRREDTVCCFFLSDMCKYAQGCPSAHIDNPAMQCSNYQKCKAHAARNQGASDMAQSQAYAGSASDPPVCCFFLQNMCKNGDRCHNLHQDTGAPCSNAHKCKSHQSRLQQAPAGMPY